MNKTSQIEVNEFTSKLNYVYNEKNPINKKYEIYNNIEKIANTNRGRTLEALRRNEVDFENISHTISGDIEVNGMQWNIKSFKSGMVISANLKNIGIEQGIKQYIASDASVGLMYLVEVNNKMYEIKMAWSKAIEFVKTFGKIDRTEIRFTTCDRKVLEWAMANA